MITISQVEHQIIDFYAIQLPEILLDEWRKQGHSGFTVPFIIGSQQFLPPDHESQTISELVYDIINNDDSLVVIRYCFTTGDIVPETRNSISGDPGFFPTADDQKQDKLFLTSPKILDDLGLTCESIIERFADKYEHEIEAGNYSENGRERGGYLPTETKFIQKTFSVYFSKPVEEKNCPS